MLHYDIIIIKYYKNGQAYNLANLLPPVFCADSWILWANRYRPWYSVRFRVRRRYVPEGASSVRLPRPLHSNSDNRSSLAVLTTGTELFPKYSNKLILFLNTPMFSWWDRNGIPFVPYFFPQIWPAKVSFSGPFYIQMLHMPRLDND